MKMMNNLIKSKNFLSLTLSQPAGLTSVLPIEFTLSNHTKVSIWDTGVIVFEPLSMTNKDIILSSGIHGNETAPIELCNQLITQMLEQKIIAKNRIMFIFGHPQAILNGTRFIDENLNRLFSDDIQSVISTNIEQQRATKLIQFVDKFFTENKSARVNQNSHHQSERIHYDLHTSIRESIHPKFAIYPYQHESNYSQTQLQFLQASDINCVLFQHEPTTTFSYFSSHKYQAKAFTIELGKALPMGENQMEQFDDIANMLTKLISNSPLKLSQYDPTTMHLYQVSRAIIKHNDNFQFNFDKQVNNFTSFNRGDILAYDGNTCIKVENATESIVFPNKDVPIGQRALLCLTPLDQIIYSS